MTLQGEDIERILREVLPDRVWVPYRDRDLGQRLARYLSLLERWNSVVSLTAVTRAEDIVTRHIAESLCCAAALPACGSVLDLGSGAGFPGIPVQLARPELRVTLAESQGRKGAFLREVVRDLGLTATVFTGRAQTLPPQGFGCVCLRAVDPMDQALAAAAVLAREWVCVMGSPTRRAEYEAGLPGWELGGEATLAGSGGSAIYLYRRADGVPRGT